MPDPNPDLKKVEFTPEQQAKVDELIKESMGRAGNEARATAARLETDMATLRADLAAAKEALKTAPPSKKKEANEDVAQLQSQIDEMKTASKSTADELKRLGDVAKAKDAEIEKARNETVAVRKQNAIQAAATEHNFFNPQVVSKLTEDKIKWDSEKSKFVVLNDEGGVRLNSTLDPMTLGEFFKEFAASNPYLVRGDVKPGVGSKENSRYDVSSNGQIDVKTVFGKGSDSKKANELGMKNPQEYKRLKAVAKAAGLIA